MRMKRNWNCLDLIAKRPLFIVQSSYTKNFTLDMKNREFFDKEKEIEKIADVRRGVGEFGHPRTWGRGVKKRANFCGHPLWMAPNLLYSNSVQRESLKGQYFLR
jgi:hypothetical protein